VTSRDARAEDGPADPSSRQPALHLLRLGFRAEANRTVLPIRMNNQVWVDVSLSQPQPKESIEDARVDKGFPVAVAAAAGVECSSRRSHLAAEIASDSQNSLGNRASWALL
jgi:hypothetical protein